MANVRASVTSAICVRRRCCNDDQAILAINIEWIDPRRVFPRALRTGYANWQSILIV
jgi:hypothetical protein